MDIVASGTTVKGPRAPISSHLMINGCPGGGTDHTLMVYPKDRPSILESRLINNAYVDNKRKAK